jgi:hypothetical protein
MAANNDSQRPKSDKLIPNSYQTPNAYCDHLMHLLTDPEWKVLSYAVRRIFGFNKHQDRISLSQFVHGTKSEKTGEQLDYGTGLNIGTVRKALASLKEFNIMIEVSSYSRRENLAAEWALQLDYNKVDWDGLWARKERTDKKSQDRTKIARQAFMEMLERAGGPMLSDNIGSQDEDQGCGTTQGYAVGQHRAMLSDNIGLYCETTQGYAVGQHTPMLSDSTPLCCPTAGQNPVGNPVGNPEESNKEPAAPAADAALDSDPGISHSESQLADNDNESHSRNGDVENNDDGKPAPPTTFQGWLDVINGSSNPTAVIGWMILELYDPGRKKLEYADLRAKDRKAFGRVAGSIKNANGDYARLAQLLWENATRPPAGHILDYVDRAVSQQRREHNAQAKLVGRRKFKTYAESQAGRDLESGGLRISD